MKKFRQEFFEYYCVLFNFERKKCAASPHMPEYQLSYIHIYMHSQFSQAIWMSAPAISEPFRLSASSEPYPLKWMLQAILHPRTWWDAQIYHILNAGRIVIHGQACMIKKKLRNFLAMQEGFFSFSDSESLRTCWQKSLWMTWSLLTQWTWQMLPIFMYLPRGLEDHLLWQLTFVKWVLTFYLMHLRWTLERKLQEHPKSVSRTFAKQSCAEFISKLGWSASRTWICSQTQTRICHAISSFNGWDWHKCKKAGWRRSGLSV